MHSENDPPPSLAPVVWAPAQPLKGRGTATRMAHRFMRDAREAFDDGWGGPEEGVTGDESAAPAAPLTQVIWEDARSALCGNDSPDIFFEQSVNPYRGCEHVMEREKLRAWR